MGIERHASVAAFFHEVLTDALDHQHVEASEPTECYLVGLLGEFTKARITDEPLSFLLVGQETQAPGERVQKLKEVGDTTLYVTGFFADSLDSKLVDPEYYIGLGEAAYTELARRLRSGSIASVYDELAAKFPRFVDVLAEVRSQVAFVGSDVVDLYQEWLRTRSEWIERRLRAMGVLVSGPAKGGKDYLQ
jgi:hypothetical protein